MSATVAWIIAAAILADLVFVPLLLSVLLRGTWSPLAERFPAAPIAPDAVRRDFQSYRVGLTNLGGMVHTAVDGSHLHLLPARLGRWCGMRAASVPWEAIEPIRLRGKRQAQVKIGGKTVVGPAWALRLAFGDAGPPPDDL